MINQCGVTLVFTAKCLIIHRYRVSVCNLPFLLLFCTEYKIYETYLITKKTISAKIITYLQLFLSDLYGYFKLQDI